MKKFFLPFVFLFIICGLSAQKRKVLSKSSTLIPINITITQTSNWCGGARPSEEMEREFRTPKPFPDCKVYIRKDSNILYSPILYSLTTNANGKINVKLPPGKYIVVNELKRDDSVYKATMERFKEATENTAPIDTQCYKIFMAEPDFVIIVPNRKSKGISKTHNYHKHCNWSGAPCVEYRGPYPP